MLNYQTTVQNFDLDAVASQYLSGSMQAVNACYECCDRHADSDAIALYGMVKMAEKNNIVLPNSKNIPASLPTF